MLVSLALADGKVTVEEASLLSGWARHFGLARDRAQQLVEEARHAPAVEIRAPIPSCG